MEKLDKFNPEKLWELLKDNVIRNLKLANERRIESDSSTTTIWDSLNHKYLLFLDKDGNQIEKELLEKLPKKGINLTYNQKINNLNKVLSRQQLKDISYQSLLSNLRRQSSNEMIYLFGLTNLKFNLDEDFKINDRLQIGNSSCDQDNTIFDDFVLQSDFFAKENNYILVKVKGPDDNETARKAENEANVLVNVLNCLFCDIAEPIGLMTKIGKNSESSVFFYLKKNSNGWSESSNIRPGKLLPYAVLNKSKLKTVKTLYESKSSKCSKLIFAMNWLGKSIKETDYGSAFLEVVIGLECIAEKQSKGMVSPSINYQISNFVAMILGKDVTERQSLIKRLKKVYDKRSLIVHDGKDSITYEDYKNIFILIRRLIHTIIYTSPFKDIDDLNSWVEEKLLS
ncbi:hypothetical protein GCM10019995_13540 [Lactobacillus kefiranofaciens subsp. kefirgranum]|uniref:HEPN domain-containing protein n=1 Tax=Lactobacillus kefiranofaciens TaxID=267818 RepID=UPI0006EF151B|nr:HEPN domain-containing protein [Lactobacillus kefiranofaciens]KRL30114.1 hypothetical protein FC94_GL001281 [Lactobacillus kefiranofaciens subsp. kefirgranum DSM 10550 = JCM 8572]MDF4142756.1 HEPN domain-containing protein [Lactobacillus kefiranofaciens]